LRLMTFRVNRFVSDRARFGCDHPLVRLRSLATLLCWPVLSGFFSLSMAALKPRGYGK
jgi:hypothetical protein